MSTSYNLELIKSPRLCGWQLDFFSRVLRIPIIGHMILHAIKRKNKFQQMVEFANRPNPSQGKGSDEELLPLYYPIHKMTPEENEMHNKMAKETPLNLQQIAEMENQQSHSKKFRHWSISDYTTRYRNRSVTPSQVVETIISVIEDMDKSVVCQMNKEELKLQATESTKRYKDNNPMGVLDGVPILVKDEIPVSGFLRTKGTSFLAELDHRDAFPIVKLKRQGALIIGKTSQHEFGLGTTGFNLFYGTPRNPYSNDPNIHHYTGGSSSGSAAAVSMGLVPLAVGADGGGSIRIPSSLCGCIGLKPTFKRVAIDMSAGCSVCHVGPMTNNVHDAALAYAIMAGAAENDHRHQSREQPIVHLNAYVPNSSSVSNKNESLKGLRVGIFEEHISDSEPNVLAAIRKAIEFYRSCGAEIVPIILPYLGEIHRAHGITITTEMFSLVEKHYQSNRFYEISPESRVSLAIGKSWTSSEFLAAQKIRSFAMTHIEDLFQNKVDVIISPGTPCCAPVITDDVKVCGESNLSQTGALMRYVIHGNFTGIPAIVFPIAYDDETSLPISLQVQAAHWREDLLLHVAKYSQDLLINGIAKPSKYINVLEK